MKDAAHLTFEFMRRSIGVASGDSGLWLSLILSRSSTMRIFSSAEYCLRVARRMSFTIRSEDNLVSGFLAHLHSLTVTMSQNSSVLQPAESDDVDGLSSTASKCQSVVARSATMRETVRRNIYQNWR
jgi:hypothetical protein